MDNQENVNHRSTDNDCQAGNHRLSSSDETNEEVTRLMEGDTYPISDNDSMNTDSETNAIQPVFNQGEHLNKSISEDSLVNNEDQHRQASSIQQVNSPKGNSKMSTMKSSNHAFRSRALDEQIKLVKQKKEEAEVLRLQRFQELLKIKEQKWQQQQSERMRKWLQLKNRDTDHRSQVEERRRKREEEAKAKIEELIRREKEREQRIHSQRIQKPESVMTMSTDVVTNRRAVSASRTRPQQLHTNSNQSPASNLLISPSRLNPIDEQPASLSHESSFSTVGRKRPTPNSYMYWLNTGDVTSTSKANFMRTTYAANCRMQLLSRSVQRCPRARIAPEPNGASSTVAEPHRRMQSAHRLTKSRPPTGMAQSVHTGTVGFRANGIPVSRSSHQLRMPTPPIIPSNNRKPQSNRPATVPPPTTESHALSSEETRRSDQRHGPNPTRSKINSKPPTTRSLMTTSHSTSSLSTANIRRIGVPPAAAPAKPAPSTTTVTMESQPVPSNPVEESTPVNVEQEKTTDDVVPSIEPIPIDEMIEIVNPSAAKREQTTVDEQEYQRRLAQKIREAQQRLELERQREEERRKQLELEEQEREQEQIRLVEEQRRAEQERLQRAIEERERENELKRQEEQRAQQQREELERRQAEEAERLQRERQERAKKEEEERIERKRRLDLIMRRTRQVSPTSKQENKTNGHEQISSPNPMSSPMTHSMSENRFPSSSSSDNFLIHQNETIPSPTLMTPIDTPKFKSPLIQSLLNKARNTRSIDNLMQSSMSSSQIMTESMIDQSNSAAETVVSSTSIQSNTPVHLSDDETNGHANLSMTSSTPINSYHERPMETATAFH